MYRTYYGRHNIKHLFKKKSSAKTIFFYLFAPDGMVKEFLPEGIIHSFREGKRIWRV